MPLDQISGGSDRDDHAGARLTTDSPADELACGLGGGPPQLREQLAPSACWPACGSPSATRPAQPPRGAEAVFRTGDLVVDLGPAGCRQEGHLTRTEYKLLATLVKNSGKVVTHRELLREVWGPGSVSQSHYVRVYTGQLRHKIEKDPARPRYLETETGVGYRLRVE